MSNVILLEALIMTEVTGFDPPLCCSRVGGGALDETCD